jgi:hypothetical protein
MDLGEARMTARSQAFFIVVVTGVAAATVTTPAAALTQKECSVKYQAAKAAGTLNGQKYSDFRKAQCGADATPAAATTPAPAAPKATETKPAPATPKATEAKPAPAPAAAPVATGNVVFPSAIDPKYVSESAGKGRMHTCRDQYAANKATNANGGLKWIEKGGGYYSECNKHLKGT